MDCLNATPEATIACDCSLPALFASLVLLIHSMLHLLVHVILKYLMTASPNSKPYTAAPKLQTVNPKGYTLSLPTSLGPQLETLHTKPKGFLQHAGTRQNPKASVLKS